MNQIEANLDLIFIRMLHTILVRSVEILAMYNLSF